MPKTAPTHLLIVVNTSRFFLSHRLLLAKGAQQRGYRVTVASPLDAEASQIIEAGFAHYPLNMGRKSMNPLGEFFTVLRFLYAMLILRPDVVHLFTVKPVLYGALTARLAGIRTIVVTITGLGFLFLKEGPLAASLRRWVGLFYKYVIRLSHIKVIFQNRDDYKLFLDRGWVSKDQGRIILGTGVDIERFHPSVKHDNVDEVIIRPIDGVGSHIDTEPEPTTLQLKENVAKILFPARFLKDKGIFELIEAGRILHKMGLKFQILLCGGLDPGNPSSLTQQELDEIVALPFVLNLGYSKNMPRTFALADIVCLPSYREGIPLALIEAAACAKPIVTTDVPGCREVVQHGKNGYLSALKNPTQLARQLATLSLDKKVRAQMGSYSRELAERLFATEVVVEQNLDCYQDATQKSKAA